MGVYEYIKRQTYKKVEEGKQEKVIADELLMNLSENEQTIYANLRRLIKGNYIKCEEYQVLRYKEGRKIKFKQKYYWCEDEKER